MVAYPGCPGKEAVKRVSVCLHVNYIRKLLRILSFRCFDAIGWVRGRTFSL